MSSAGVTPTVSALVNGAIAWPRATNFASSAFSFGSVRSAPASAASDEKSIVKSCEVLPADDDLPAQARRVAREAIGAHDVHAVGRRESRHVVGHRRVDRVAPG
jgi:hypothetical protein